MKKLLVLDGNSIINRAFYGVRPLSTTTGIPTNAIFGFLNILDKLKAEEKPDALILGCTHFPHLRPLIEQAAEGRAVVLDSSDAVARQVKRLLAARDLLAPKTAVATHDFCRTHA